VRKAASLKRRLVAGIACAAGWLALTVVALSPWPAIAEVQYRAVSPAATDAAIHESYAPHRVSFDPAALRRNQLLIFLPGTGGRNDGSPRAFSTTAAELGYHVIDLAYPNSISATVCWRHSDPDCFEKFRWEIIEGRDTSPLIVVGRADSIENRLEKLLQMLNVREPERGWGQFLDPAGGVAWAKVALAGQSQGGGHAALIARDHRVARVLLFGAPKDYNPKLGKPAPWYRPGSTPVERFFAYVHTRDRQGCDFPQQLEIYRAMGLAAEPRSVDGAAPPYGNAHVLLTSYPGRAISSREAHVIGISNQLRDASGTPLFKPVWTYMLTSGE
jgi:pimeloyl-ACP methyl ester carboxylesterase